MKLVVKGATRPLRGEVSVPGDKSIGHRALIFASLATGPSDIYGLSDGLDNVATRRAFAQMGVSISEHVDSDTSFVRVDGVGLRGLTAPATAIDCGNSGTTMRLLAGLLCGQSFSSKLVGDESLSARPMRRVTTPLRQRGARIQGVSFSDVRGRPNERPPLSISGTTVSLQGLDYASPIASAQVKSALLLSGLYAESPTQVREPSVSRDHTERMMKALGIPLTSVDGVITLDPGNWSGKFDGVRWLVPGDFSSAAFLITAASIVPDSDITIRNVGLNKTRTGFLDAMRKMGASIEVSEETSPIRGVEAAGKERTASLRVRFANLQPESFGGELVTRMIDEVPILAVACATARGQSAVRDAAELRVKESDRIAIMALTLRAFGIEVTETDDGFGIEGGQMHGAQVEPHHDHRIAMSGAILGLVASGETRVQNADCVATSYPSFVSDLQSLGADIRVEAADG